MALMYTLQSSNAELVALRGNSTNLTHMNFDPIESSDFWFSVLCRFPSEWILSLSCWLKSLLEEIHVLHTGGNDTKRKWFLWQLCIISCLRAHKKKTHLSFLLGISLEMDHRPTFIIATTDNGLLIPQNSHKASTPTAVWSKVNRMRTKCKTNNTDSTKRSTSNDLLAFSIHLSLCPWKRLQTSTLTNKVQT